MGVIKLKCRKFLKKLIKPFYRCPPFKYVLNLAIKHVWAARPLRKYFTNNFSSVYLAIGEQNRYAIAPDWITVDLFDADFSHDFKTLAPLPFHEESMELVYTSHMIEHLPENSCQHFFNESYRLLKQGGVLRIEAPDAEKIILEYKRNNDDFFFNLLNKEEKSQFGRVLNTHDVFMGLLSCYIEQGKHLSVRASKEVIDDKLNSLSFGEFTDWCVSLQTPLQRESGGHINPIYFDKIKKMLCQANFSGIKSVSVGCSEHKLMDKKLSGIERSHRASYSFYVEAIK